MDERPHIQLGWFKRDLRVSDHRPLAEAVRRSPVLPLYVIEPSLINTPDFDTSHWSLIRESLLELRAALAQPGQPLVVRVGHDCPVPIVNHDEALATARRHIAEFRRRPELAAEIEQVFAEHGSRRRPSARVKTKPVSPQMILFS